MSGDVVGDALCGVFAGTLGKLVDYPLDTVKTRLQAPKSPYRGVFDCVWTTFKREGFIRGFYTGLPAAVLGAAAEKAVIFAAYNQGKDAYHHVASGGLFSDTPVPPRDPDGDTLACCVAGGVLSGIPSTIISTPTELVKCRMQVHQGRWSNTAACARDILASQGLLALGRGWGPCLVRELLGGVFWFGTFELLVRAALPPGAKRSEASGWLLPIAGGTAGVVYWTATYPLDVVKTRMQVSDRAWRQGAMRTLSELHRDVGVRGIFRGWSVASSRKFVATGVVFSVYESTAAKWRTFTEIRSGATPPSNAPVATV